MLCANGQSPTWWLCLASNWKALSNHVKRGHLPPFFVREAGRAALRGSWSWQQRNTVLGKAEALSFHFGEQPEGWGEGLERSQGLWNTSAMPSLPSLRGTGPFLRIQVLCIHLALHFIAGAPLHRVVPGSKFLLVWTPTPKCYLQGNWRPPSKLTIDGYKSYSVT